MTIEAGGLEEIHRLHGPVLAGKLATQKEIKMRVKNWVGDYQRA